MPGTDTLNEQQLLATHRSTLTILLQQLGLHTSAHVPPATLHGITHARTEIARLKAALRAAGVTADDLPNDEATPEEHAAQVSNASTSGAQITDADIAGIVDARGAGFSRAKGVHITGVQVGNVPRKRKAEK